MTKNYEKNSLSLAGTVAMGTGVMIGAGIFALTGQVAALAGTLFPLAFLLAAVVSALSAYSYIVVSRAYPSAGGIAMILTKAYGKNTVAAGAAMLMAFSMIINESLVARTFAIYATQPFGISQSSLLIPALALGVILLCFGINIAGNQAVGAVSKVAAVIKIGGILVFAGAALWAAGFTFQAASGPESGSTVSGVIAGTALAVLAYKGFTTITNSGGEVVDPHRNVGRAIVIALVICVLVYMTVAFAVGSALTIPEIVGAQNYSLAEATRPAFGNAGVSFTAAIAVVATVSGLLASFFAVSRMLAMLTDMELVPHRHFGLPGDVQDHTLVYTVVVAGFLAVVFDLSRIASIGIIFYLVMDMTVHWGVFRHLRVDVNARAWVLLLALLVDAVALAVFVLVRGADDPVVVAGAIVAVIVVFVFEGWYLRLHPPRTA